MDHVQQCHEFPIEIWHLVFGFLTQNQKHAVTLVCRYFLTIAQPLLFQSVAILFVRPDCRYELQKLAFYASPRIAASVVSCRVAASGLGAATDALEVFFGLLPRFTNMHNVHLSLVPLTTPYLRQFAALPRLRALTLQGCAIPLSKAPLPALAPHTVDVIPAFGCSDALPALATALLHPAHLRALALPPLHAVAPQLAAAGPWPHLRTLRCLYTAAFHPAFPALLAALPALTTLRFDDADERVLRLPPGAAPRLRAFDGPVASAAAAMHGRALRHLETRLDDPADFAAAMRSAPGCAALQTLGILALRVSRALLAAVVQLCPALRALSVVAHVPDAHGAAEDAHDVFAWLADLALPPRLALLSVYIICRPPGALAEARLRAALAAHPHLRCVEVRYGEHRLCVAKSERSLSDMAEELVGWRSTTHWQHP